MRRIYVVATVILAGAALAACGRSTTASDPQKPVQRGTQQGPNLNGTTTSGGGTGGGGAAGSGGATGVPPTGSQ